MTRHARQPQLQVFKNKNGDYILVMSTAQGGSTNGVPHAPYRQLAVDEQGVRQMSRVWIEGELQAMVADYVLSGQERADILAALPKDATKRIYAHTNAHGTTYHEIEDVMKDGAPCPEEARVSDVTWRP